MDLKAYFAKRAEELEKSHLFHKAMAGHHDTVAAAHAENAKCCKAAAEGLDDGHELKGHMHKVAANHEAMSTAHGHMAKAHAAECDQMKADGDYLKTAVVEVTKVAPPVPPPPPTEKGTTMKPEDIKKCAAAMKITEEEFKKLYIPEPPPAPAPQVVPLSTANGMPLPAGLDVRITEVTGKLVEKALFALDNDPEVAASVQATVLRFVDQALGKKIVPDSISSVATQNTPPDAFGIKAVPRPGAPVPAINKTIVPLELQHMLGDEGDEQ